MADPNKIKTNEIHSLIDTKAVWPVDGAFFNNAELVVEGTNDRISYTTLSINDDYMLSPVYVELMAVTGEPVYSYLVILGTWSNVRIKYNFYDNTHPNDLELFSKIADMTFDRLSADAWLEISGMQSFHPRTRDPVYQEKAELEILNTGLQRIKEAIELLAPNAGLIDINQNMTNLEVRQTLLEAMQLALQNEFDISTLAFADIVEQFNLLQDQLRNGLAGNVTVNGGYIYLQDTAIDSHVINHGLNTNNLDVTIWNLTSGDYYEMSELSPIEQLDLNNIIVDTINPTELLVVVREVTVNDGGYIFDSGPTAATSFTINHGLNTRFPSIELWFKNTLTNNWEKGIGGITITDADTIDVRLTNARVVKVVIQRPLSNAFLYKSESISDYHVIRHNLYTPQIGVSVYVETSPELYELVLLPVRLMGSNILEIETNVPVNIKVVCQPALIATPTFQQQTILDYTSLRDEMDNLQLAYLATGNARELWRSVDNGGASLNYTITHALNTENIDFQLLTLQPDGKYYPADADVVIVDNSTITVTLTVAREIKLILTALQG